MSCECSTLDASRLVAGSPARPQPLSTSLRSPPPCRTRLDPCFAVPQVLVTASRPLWLVDRGGTATDSQFACLGELFEKRTAARRNLPQEQPDA
jgi:hypothetical protein